MGMLAAVEAWTRRDHRPSERMEGWLDTIRQAAGSVATVRSDISQPNGPSNVAPTLRVYWNAAKVGITGGQLAQAWTPADRALC